MKKILVILSIILAIVQLANAGTYKVKVTESIPIYKKSIVQMPNTSYEEVQVQVPYTCGNVDRNSIGFDTIIGGIIGVAIGNQIGHGSGRDAAKVIGGVTGAHIANQSRKGDTCYRMEFRKKPITSYEEKIERRLVGYRNCGYIDGKQICNDYNRKQKYIILHY